MWLANKHGFYSVAQDRFCGNDEVMVRARVKADLERLLDAMYLDTKSLPEILSFPDADYAYRVKVKQNEWAGYLSKCAMTMTYPTVKDNIVPKDDPAESRSARSRAYYDMWHVMREFQDDVGAFGR